MAEFPQLPIHVQRWLSELPDLTLEEHGAYFLTIMQMWLQPDCGMPDEPEWLRKKLRVHPQKWLRLWPKIRSFMTEIDGRLYQKTLGLERTYLRDKSEKGKRNAEARWEIFKANRLKNKETDYATQHRILDAPTPTPTPTPKEERAEGAVTGADAPGPFTENDCVSADGKVIVREAEIVEYEKSFPNLKNVRGQIRAVLRIHADKPPNYRRKAIDGWLSDKDQRSAERNELAKAKQAQQKPASVEPKVDSRGLRGVMP